jgi:hypothetical protein
MVGIQMDNFEAWQKILSEWNKVQRMKHLNQRLYDQLGGSIIHILNYAYENNTSLPNRDKLYELVDRVEKIIGDINVLTPPTTPRHQHEIDNILNT